MTIRSNSELYKRLEMLRDRRYVLQANLNELNTEIRNVMQSIFDGDERDRVTPEIEASARVVK